MIQWALQDRLLNEETSTQLRHHLGRRGKGEMYVCIGDNRWTGGGLKGEKLRNGSLCRGEDVVVLLLVECRSAHSGPHGPYELISVLAQFFCRLW